MSVVVWSINIMVGILLAAVGYVIYWIFKYDEWYPNDIDSHVSSQHGTDASGDKELEVRAEQET